MMTDRALERESCPALEGRLGLDVADVDIGTQRPTDADMHNLGIAGISRQEQLARIAKYEMRVSSSCDPKDLAGYLHFLQDGEAPAHQGNPEWHGMGQELRHNPFGLLLHGLRDTFVGNGTYERGVSMTATAIKEFKARCPCICNE